MIGLTVCLLLAGVDSSSSDVGVFVKALELFHLRGTHLATDPANDFQLKTRIAKALAKDSLITFSEVEDFMTSKEFKEIAGGDESIDKTDVLKALSVSVPDSRLALNPKLRAHAEYLTTTFDMIDEQHRAGAEKLANWIASKHESGKSLDVIVVCTGNSRRSILGSSMGNLAAAYYGLNVRFHSGGTDPTAFNTRTMVALKDVGFEIEPTGSEAPRGEAKTANPMYRVLWGKGLEALEFSKHYSNDVNPQSGFAAIMVCTEADAGCPIVKGAATRISMPYLDPKTYDDGAFEAQKYAERRDDIGRMMLSVMCQVRPKLEAHESKR